MLTWAELVSRRVGRADIELELVVRCSADGKGMWTDQIPMLLQPGDRVRLVLQNDVAALGAPLGRPA